MIQGPKYNIYRYSNPNQGVESGPCCQMFSNHPDLLPRDTYESAKLRKIFQIRRLFDQLFAFILQNLTICLANFKSGDY